MNVSDSIMESGASGTASDTIASNKMMHLKTNLPLYDISIIIPIHNEQDNIEPLYNELNEVMQEIKLEYEIIFIDDGSKDQSLDRLLRATAHDSHVKIIQLRRNFGQTAAMAAGIDHSRGRIIIPMDADLQNDPHDIPAMLKKLDEPPGYDIVSGWRKIRKDKWLVRRLPSKVANRLVRMVTGMKIRDFGCSLKAYRREVLEQISLSSELHRFLPALAIWHGARITEIVVNHRPRIHGQTKYGLRRTIKVLFDLVIVKFFSKYMAKPLYFFGKIGLVTLMLACLSIIIAIGQKYGLFGQPEGVNLNRNILTFLSALLCSVSVQCILFGVVSELIARIYREARGTPCYRIRNIYVQDDTLETTA